jgi:hypothetical protein
MKSFYYRRIRRMLLEEQERNKSDEQKTEIYETNISLAK